MSFSWDLSIVTPKMVSQMEKEMEDFCNGKITPEAEERFYRYTIGKLNTQLGKLQQEGREKCLPNYSLGTVDLAPTVQHCKDGTWDYSLQFYSSSTPCGPYSLAYLQAYFTDIILPKHRREMAAYEDYDEYRPELAKDEYLINAVGGRIDYCRPKVMITLPVVGSLRQERYEIVPNPSNLRVLKSLLEQLSEDLSSALREQD